MLPDLQASIDARTVTAAELIAYATADATIPLSMGNIINPNCITDADLPNVYAALDWWPKDCPPVMRQHGLLPLVQMCITHRPTDKPMSVLELLNIASVKVVAWLQAEGRSVVNPNETSEDRKARKNKEAQQRHRERNTKSTDPVLKNAAEASAEAYRVYQQACADRKASDMVHKGYVAAAWAAYERAKHALEGIREQTSAAGLA